MHLNPKVTVLTVVYNGERYIREAVDSVLNQSYRDFEYLLVDNNSTDSTPKILESYARGDKRIKIIKETKQGPLYARSTGLKFAKGEWIAVLDADDMALPNRLECQLNLIKNNPAVVFVGSGCIMIDEDGKFLKEYNYPCEHKSLVRRLENHQAFPPHSSALFRRTDAIRLNGYRFPHAEDYDLWLRLSEQGEIACVQSPLIKLRRYVESRSYNVAQRSYILYKVVPLVLHLRRKAGLSDLATIGGKEWNDFLEWAWMRMERLGYFQKAEAMRELNRIRYSRTDNNLYRLFQMLRQVLSNRSARRALIEPMYLKNIAERLTEESKVLF